MTLTLSLLGAAIAVFLFALFMDSRPIVPGKVRLFPYKGLMFVAIAAIIVLAGHLVTLVTGTPLIGTRGGF